MHIALNPLWGESANRVARSLLFGDLRFQIDRVIYSHPFGLVSGVFRASNRHNSSFSVITVKSNPGLYTHRSGVVVTGSSRPQLFTLPKFQRPIQLGKSTSIDGSGGIWYCCNRLYFIGEDCSFPPRVRHTLFWLLATVERYTHFGRK